jgi:hypothetical protein
LRLEIRRLEELEVFNALRLSVEDAAEAATEVLVELAGETELARTELVQIKLFAELLAELLTEILAELLVEILAEIFEVKASLVVYYLGSSVS